MQTGLVGDKELPLPPGKYFSLVNGEILFLIVTRSKGKEWLRNHMLDLYWRGLMAARAVWEFSAAFDALDLSAVEQNTADEILDAGAVWRKWGRKIK